MKKKRPVPRGHLVDFVVGEQHDGARDPKGDAGRDNGVDLVDDELALIGMLSSLFQVVLGCVPAKKDRHERDGARPRPNVGQHQSHLE